MREGPHWGHDGPGPLVLRKQVIWRTDSAVSHDDDADEAEEDEEEDQR